MCRRLGACRTAWGLPHSATAELSFASFYAGHSKKKARKRKKHALPTHVLSLSFSKGWGGQDRGGRRLVCLAMPLANSTLNPSACLG